MQKSQNISKRILAALIFFTRLPFWKICNIEKEYYEKVVPLWPLAGWLTGSIMIGVFYLCQMLTLSVSTSVILVLISRILVTGALHEDGFADFCDGFGGGTTRQRTLEIMKDSHIGTYGVLGLILYYLLMWNVLCILLSQGMHPVILLGADAACKFCSSTIIYSLPYARKEQEAKNKLIYSKTSFTESIISFAIGYLPLILIAAFLGNYRIILLALIVPYIVCKLLFNFMKRRIQGYTGDCCGATFILSELSFYLALCLHF